MNDSMTEIKAQLSQFTKTKKVLCGQVLNLDLEIDLMRCYVFLLFLWSRGMDAQFTNNWQTLSFWDVALQISFKNLMGG